MTTRILAFDPGSKQTAWAYLETVAGKTTIVSYDTCDSDYLTFRKLIRNGDHVIIERIEGYSFAAFRTKYLISTARAEGYIEAAALENGNNVSFVPSSVWRKLLLGKATAGDDEVKEYVYGRFPKLMRTNEHTRDAICVGLWGVDTWASNNRSSTGSQNQQTAGASSSPSSAKPGKRSTGART